MARVLLVEDEASIRQPMERFLKGAGYAVCPATDVPEARQWLAGETFDVMVSDIVLPGESGIVLLHYVRQTFPQMLVIMMTGEPTVETAAEALRTGAFEYLSKPVSKSQILHAVQRAARMKELEDQKTQLAEANRQYQENLEMLVDQRTRALRESEERLRQSEKQLHALAARLISIREAERAHIAREIHDELGQLLTGLKMDLHWLSRKISEACPAANAQPITQRLKDALDLSDTTISCVQRLAAELRPSALDKLGLCAALRQELRQFAGRTGLKCDFELPDEEPVLEPDLALTLFRISQESLTNIMRHASASRIQLELARANQTWWLRISDNGCGISDDALSAPKSLGLLGIKERALNLGGEASFARLPKGGTQVTVRIPDTPGQSQQLKSQPEI